MKTYIVGGAVRDELLGLPVADRDWVVVGATPEQMVALGYRPVGRDFPVFLHPATHEEYALARTERKSGRGYRGFTIYSDQDVTLEQDLARRDLTINAMAKDEDGVLIDPFGGASDLKLRILRHVSDAYSEDPVRIVRTARFAARFSFRIADETLALMRHMVEAGEADHLVAELVWREFARGLQEAHPAQMLSALERCGALAKLVPELLPALEGEDSAKLLERAVRSGAVLEVRFALLAWPLGKEGRKGLDAMCERLRAPNEVHDLASLALRMQQQLRSAARDAPEALLATLKASDALRRGARFRSLLEVGRLAEPGAAMTLAAKRLNRALEAAASVDAGAIARETEGAEIPRRIDAARLAAVRAALG
ncbi:MAG: multifunctional CCA tRNA nucleotidyl transferase/2'3'-cyclic phosphodiesterase/2'nucleotidase/phosphatase [Betaproteobacteria bacterium]|nr:multifunctional CCA tRNA nucleotidyl transferase/2'3'-cyclic phosphodiesterase/2'nucleotidase/phosphatase [Betaproteobacteria bacterium]